MDLIYTFSREVISSQVIAMLTTILHDPACWLWALSQVNDEHNNLLLFLLVCDFTEPSNLFIAQRVCVKNDWYLAFRCESLFCSKYSCLCVCSSCLPCRAGLNALHSHSVQNSQLYFVSVYFSDVQFSEK